MVTDTAGKVVWQNEATPFGEWSGEVGVMHLKGKFTGKDFDDDIGLYYYNARWMDPETGRFISEDPAKDSNNWYAYCYSNPMRFTDPTGLHYEVGIGWEEDAKTPTPESGTSGGHQPEPTANPKQEQIIKDIDTKFKAQVTQGLKKGQGSIIVGLDGVGLFTMDEKLAKEYLNSGLPITEFIEKNDLVLWQGVTTDTIYPRMTDFASTQYNYSLGPNWEIAEFIMGAKGVVQLGKALVAKVIAANGLTKITENVIEEVITSSMRTRSAQITEGARAIAKKIGHALSGEYSSAFEGFEATQENAGKLIKNILGKPSRTFVGDKVIDVYNAAGQGVRFNKLTHEFIGFIEEGLANQ